MYFRMLYDDKLAQASYLIGCQATGEAVVIDPERDIDRYIELAEAEDFKIVAATETHIHADFLSGSRELAERTGAKVYLSDEGDADWKYQWVNKKLDGGSYNYQWLKDGDSFKVGNIELTAMHTPGHTPEHICFMVTDHGGGATEPMGIATGDFVFVGDVGRPDLLETAAGHVGVKEKSARILYQSLQRFQQFPDFLQLWPGHGAGSACGKALGAVPQSTVGYEKRFNAAVNDAKNEEKFVRSILYGQPEPPLYFARMKRDNKLGPNVLGKLPSPPQIDVNTMKEALYKGAAVLDTRLWEQYAAGHLTGALHAPMENNFPTVAGSYVEENIPIYLLIEENRVKEAVIDLIRIGLDNIAGYVTPEVFEEYVAKGGEVQKTQYFNIKDLQNRTLEENALVLDVRRADEFDAGHLPEAQNIAHTRLLTRLDELSKDRPIYVHCRTSNRSAYASGLLDSKGYNVTLLVDGYEAWAEAGGDVVVEAPQLV